MKYSPEEISRCIEILTDLAEFNEHYAGLPHEQKIALMKLAGQISRPDSDQLRKRKRSIRKLRKKAKADEERQARAATGIRKAREAAVFSAPDQITDGLKEIPSTEELKSPRNCYVCKVEFTRLHHFYDTMCPNCAEFNYQKRFQTTDLRGQVALITGSRLKIGYQATLMLLRAGASVIATTRFPVDSALRYSREADYDKWKDRLHIHGLDLRHTPSVELFCDFIAQTWDRLDILINNAAQTVRRPPGFYVHLMENELKAIEAQPLAVRELTRHHQMCTGSLKALAVSGQSDGSDLPVSWNVSHPGIGLRESAQLSQIPYAYDNSLAVDAVFPRGELDVDLQQVDLRTVNSWRLKIGEIPTAEMLELQLINSIAPFVLCNKLTPVMKRDNTGQKHVVNVSAMEGKFLRFKKDSRHPHTNMAKAALNMLTHSASGDLEKYGIYMNAVDTGWVTDEDPVQLSQLKQELHDFQPPLDIVDGAARVCDPVFHGINTGKHWCGKFLKDYFPIDW